MIEEILFEEEERGHFGKLWRKSKAGQLNFFMARELLLILLLFLLLFVGK